MNSGESEVLAVSGPHNSTNLIASEFSKHLEVNIKCCWR